MSKKPSSSSMGRWSPWPLYPIAFSAVPFLALLSFNTGPAEPAAGLRSLLASVLFGTLLFFLL
jgi:hypothetical protein